MPGYKGPRFWLRYHEIVHHINRFAVDKNILEVGAGTLELSSYLAKNNSVTAIDLSDSIYENRALCPQRIQNNLSVYRTDFFEHNFKDQKFDLIISMEVMEHIEDDLAFLERIKGLLNPSGIAVISVPAHMKFFSRDDVSVGHFKRYESSDIIKLANQINMKLEGPISYGWPWINLGRLARIVTTPVLIKGSNEKSQEQRSIGSGERIKQLNFLRFFINQVTTYPLWLISRLFNHLDLSEGYIFYLCSS